MIIKDKLKEYPFSEADFKQVASGQGFNVFACKSLLERLIKEGAIHACNIEGDMFEYTSQNGDEKRR